MVSLGIVYGEIGSSVSHPVNRIAYVRAMARGPPPDTAPKRDGGGGGVGGIDGDWEIVFRF